MKKLFISQPMKGKTKEEILAVRKRAIENAKAVMDDDVEIIESYFEDYNPDDGCVPLKYLSKSLELLADADIVYFAKGWESARGCRIEYQCATDYGIAMAEECTNGSSESGYNFGTALEIARHGGKIARKGWNGKGMFLYYVPAASYAPCRGMCDRWWQGAVWSIYRHEDCAGGCCSLAGKPGGYAGRGLDCCEVGQEETNTDAKANQLHL